MSTSRIKGSEGVIIDSQYWLELPKAPTKKTAYAERAGMIRYNNEWKAFEGVLQFTDGSVAYRRFANLDENGLLLTSQLPSSVTSGLDYVGTYSPIIDDVDPPMTGITPLPAPSASNAGEYLIIRGLYDAADAHFRANNPTTSPVIFTPTNSTGQGNWIQIKYYVGSNPSSPSTPQVVNAYGRIVTASIPATGHVGLVSLAQDVELTRAFTNSNTNGSETALSDGDWIISDGTRIQRLRNSRVSITAAAVLYDRNVVTSAGRPYGTSSGSVQDIIDQAAIYGLRRTGDSMYDDGSKGRGRLAVTLGTAAAPAIAFNSTPYSPTQPGTDPTKWSDTNSGIFSPGKGLISISSNGSEKMRVANGVITLIQSGTFNAATNPTLQFQGAGNTSNLGITAVNNTFSFSTNNVVQVELTNAQSTFHGSATVDANMLIRGNATINGNTVVGDASSDTLTVNATSTFGAPATFNSSSRFNHASNLFNVGLQVGTNGVLTLQGANPSTIRQSGSELRFDMANFSDVNIYDGASARIKFNRYGIKLPYLNPINDGVGEDGMIAYSPARNSIMQKSNGTWSNVGAGSIVVIDFTTANWVASGAYYTYTIPNADVRSVSVQEKVGNNYLQVEVDSVTLSPTNAVISIPAGSPDLRFNGRVLVTYSK